MIICDEMPYVGQVPQAVRKQVQALCDSQVRKNIYMWPQSPEVFFYTEKHLYAVIKEPEQQLHSNQSWVEKIGNNWNMPGAAGLFPLSYGPHQLNCYLVKWDRRNIFLRIGKHLSTTIGFLTFSQPCPTEHDNDCSSIFWNTCKRM